MGRNKKNNKKKQIIQNNDGFKIQTPDDPTTWTIGDVLLWAKGIGLDQDDTNILEREKVDGEALIAFTYDELTSKPFLMPGGPAKKIITATKRLRPSTPPPSSGSPLHVSPSSLVSSEAFLALEKKYNLVKKQLTYAEDDIWEVKSECSASSSQSGKQQANFRKNLIKYYGNEEKCMITGIAAKGRALTAGHIWRASQNMNPALHKYGLTAKDVESPRNGLLMLTTIEDAFGAEQLCFFYNFTTREIQLHILDPDLIKQEYAPGHQFSELEGRVLDLKGPFRRLLARHCKASYAHAFKKGWITETHFEAFEDFSHLSERAIENDENT